LKNENLELENLKILEKNNETEIQNLKLRLKEKDNSIKVLYFIINLISN
jgi:hypothetical protein